MPDSAMRATELQFARLLKEAANNFDVRLHLFAMPEIPRGGTAASRMEGFYADVAHPSGRGNGRPDHHRRRADRRGAEPGALLAGPDPPDGLGGGRHGFHLVFLSRRACRGCCIWTASRAVRCQKSSAGVFASLRTGDDPLLAGLPARGATPHSRKNGLLESDLTARNYRVLSRLTDGSVDLFVREGRSRFVFLQGHPEYGAEALGREYLRDVGRFLRGEGVRPTIPENYFDRVTENALSGAGRPRRPAGRYNEVVMGAVPLQSWRSYTLRLFANWIAAIAAEKPRRRAPRAGSIHKSA